MLAEMNHDSWEVVGVTSVDLVPPDDRDRPCSGGAANDVDSGCGQWGLSTWEGSDGLRPRPRDR